jgi:predicted nucleic acid-binding Zn ribbon protein
MPTYVYDILDKKGRATGRTLEVMQSIKASALTRHPETGEPVRRAIVAPVIGSGMSKRSSVMSNSNLERLGFTKYENRGKGTMVRTAGKRGPREISAD